MTAPRPPASRPTGSTSGTRYDHYDVLHAIESMFGTAHAGRSMTASDITGIWK
ncbi:hypothetical protein OG535_37275 [Kitasatospora sp. NBC_00085]|uniref:hypothetical protein n=1 Tax=unclassified Kitasatospora TaxID=2633591 RepID=UPI0032553439